MTIKTARSFCRICAGFCGTSLTIEDDQIIKIIGDKQDPMTKGFACFKGLQAVEQHYGNGRLMHSLRRENGELKPGESEALLSEAGQKLKAIVDEHGPSSVAFFTGTQAYTNTLDPILIAGFAAALGTPRSFMTMTIDQSAKWICEGRMGAWEAGPQAFEDSDIWVVVGNNPLVSLLSSGGADIFAFFDPVKTMKARRASGKKLIVIDPRRTETAEFADIHLQLRPGTDAELAAALIHTILAEGWHDAAFCEQYVDGVDRLRELVAPFAPEACANWIGVSAEEIRTVAREFAHQAKSGMFGTGTGANMGRHSNLVEHLYQTINVICGRFRREGESVLNPGTFLPYQAPNANVKPAFREWEHSPKSETHGLGTLRGYMMSTEIPFDILHQGDNPIRAMICVGGNLAVALPDQKHAVEALQKLDLLIVIDPRLSETAKLADYVIAPTLQYERADHTAFFERMTQQAYSNATAAVVPPPKGSDLVDEAHALWVLARELGVQLPMGEYPVPMEKPPVREELISILASAGRVSYEEALAAGQAQILDSVDMKVGPRNTDARFTLLPEDVEQEILALHKEQNKTPETLAKNQFQIAVRRHREMQNSTGADFEATWKRMPGNQAYFHNDELERLNLKVGDPIDIIRDDVSISARAAKDNGVRHGMVSISHCWPGKKEKPWEATNALVKMDSEVQDINRMPVMTGFYVEVRKAS